MKNINDKILLTSEMVIDMIMGVNPPFSVIEHPSIIFTGGMNHTNDHWIWRKTELKSKTKTELWDIYCLCKGWN